MKSKLIYTIVAFFFAIQTIVAQNKISGTIKDEKSKEVLKMFLILDFFIQK